MVSGGGGKWWLLRKEEKEDEDMPEKSEHVRGKKDLLIECFGWRKADSAMEAWT